MAATPSKKSSSATMAMVTTSTAAEPQRSHLTIKQKIAIIQKKFEEPKWTQERLGRWAKERFQLQKQPTQATVSNILKTREQLMRASISQDFCRVRAVKHPELDAAVHTWVLSLERNGVKFSSEDIKEKAQQLGQQLQLPRDLSFSNGWVASFMERHQLKLRKSQQQQQREEVGGTGSPHQRFGAEGISTMSSIGSDSTMAPDTQSEASTMHAPIQVELHTYYADLLANYAPRDVFTMDEVGLFYCMEPKRTKSRRVSLPANSRSKARIALALAVNMDASEKLEQFFVGSQQRPLCFDDRSAEQIHFSQYYYNSGAWITGPIFQDWVLRLNHAMLEQNRRILLIVGDAPSHVQMELSNVRTLVLPAKRPHPFGVGIVRAFKTLFRIRHLAHAADQAELGQDNVFEVDQLQAMRWAKQAWLEVSTDVICRCWNHTGLSKGVGAAGAVIPSSSSSSSSSSSMAVRMDQEMEDAICGFLAHLNLLYQVSIESIVSPAGEDDVHYIYNDATIHDLVMRKSGQEDSKGTVAAQWRSSNNEEETVSVRDEQLPSLPPLKKRRVVVSDKRKAELYRDVIAVLDDESEIDKQLVQVIQFLRGKQAAARQELKKQNSPSLDASARHHANSTNAAYSTPPSRSSSALVLEEAKDTQEPMAMMLI